MAATATPVDDAPDTTAARPARPLVRRAGLVLLVAGGIGLVGQLLFYDVAAGINLPIGLGLLALGGWLLRSAGRPATIDAWLGPAGLVFAAFAAIRADPFIVACDILVALGLVGGALASFGGRSVVARPFGSLINLGLGTLGWVLGGAIPAAADAGRALPPGRTALRRASPALPVARGLLIALPLLVIFIALFSAADAVFAQRVDDLFGWELNFGDLGWRIVLAAVIAWFAAGAIAFSASVAPTEHRPATATAGPRVGSTELVTVLVILDALFAAFVVLQAAYLFGGFDTIQAAGLTYADYARRGFFELVVVAILAGGVVVAADRLVSTRTRALVAGAIGLAILTGFVLVSAASRMRLYQEAYGWTELRFYVLGTIVVLGIGLVGLVVTLLTDRVRWMGHVMVVTGLAVGLALTVIGPVRFITEQNVARVLDPSLVPPNGSSGLDVAYAASLGDDAIPELVRVLPALDPDDAELLSRSLSIRLDELRTTPALDAWQAWNAGRAAARDALEAARAAGQIP
ncbi:MAG TPA: DUF4173 domain-containing protein [Candidatus Limnocylindria bacterium]|nr:DUF4173 domain-containing protein [Candidatus Limnocylindria bacterium]